MFEDIVKSFITLFVIINPIGNLTIFIGLSQGLSAKKRIKIVNQALSIATVLLFIFLFFGLQIFNFFGINVESFEIAGGIILLLIAIVYVLDIHTRKNKSTDEDIAAVPMSTPLLIGPGTITSVIILVNQFGVIVTLLAAMPALLCTWIIMRFSNKIYKTIGAHWSLVISRIMGLILAAIAIEFIREGIVNIVKGM